MISDDYTYDGMKTSIEFVSDNLEIQVQNLPELRIVEALETCDELEARDETRDDTCEDCAEKTVELVLESSLE